MLKKLVMIGGGVGALVVVALLFFVFVGMPGGGEVPEDGEAGADGETAHEEAAEGEGEAFIPFRIPGRLGPYLTLEDRVFTLVSPPDAPRYVKLQVVLEFETEDEEWFHLTGEALEEELEEIREELPVYLLEDAVTSVVSSKTIADISSPQGKDELREELHAVVTALLPEQHLGRVMFTNFITQ